MTTRSLDGTDWTMKGYIDGEWKAKLAFRPDCSDTRGWIPASVPGSVQHDLWQAGAVPNPYVEMNSLLLEWVPTRTWVYKKVVRVNEEEASQRLILSFKGIDHEAEIYLDGEKLGTSKSMFIPAAFELTGKLKPDTDHLLAVVLFPAPDSQSQLGSTWKVRSTKTRMNYWWDFCPRMIHLGLWDGVQLEITGTVRMEDVHVRSTLLDDQARAAVSVSTKLNASKYTSVTIETEIRRDGRTLSSSASRHELSSGDTLIHTLMYMEHPELWQPNGFGDPTMYEVKVRVILENGTVSDEEEVPFGIRSLEWAYNEKADPEALPYTFVVNGRRMYIKGWNWVPTDVLYGTIRNDKLEHMVKLAHRAGVNLIRVWGGGLIEKDYFYDLCDRYGILVWQEFNQSSSSLDNKPSEDPAYIQMMVEEAEVTVKRKRNHPSLALWCGGNELEGWDKLPLDDSDPVLAALKAVVEAHDPGRLWLPCSSSGKMPFNGINTLRNNPEKLHDVHGPWHHQGLKDHYTLFNLGASLLHSEFGAEGLSNLRSIQATLSEEQQWPVTLDNPVWYHLGAWWVKDEKWRDMFGEIRDLETLVETTQYAQGEAVRYAIERNRHRQFQNSGSLPWQFNEPYPMAACTSAIDYYGRPKALYYAVAGTYVPVLVSAKVPMQAWAGEKEFHAQLEVVQCGASELAGLVLTCTVIGTDGRAYARGELMSSVPAGGAVLFGELSCPMESIQKELFFLDLVLRDAEGKPIADNRYIFSKCDNLSPMLALTDTHIDTSLAYQGDRWEISLTNQGAVAALLVRLEDDRGLQAPGYVYFSASHFSLLPGECKRVTVEWNEVEVLSRRVIVKGLNTEQLVILEEGEHART